MGSVLKAYVVAGTALLTACGGPGSEAPADASLDDFCAAKNWLVTEGMDRFSATGIPAEDELVDLMRDWSGELARVGTPDNMSEEARVGFEKLVDRLADMEADDVGSGSLNWQAGDWEDDEEKSFANYVTNSCP